MNIKHTLIRPFAQLLALVVLIAGMGAAPALAQENSETAYKKKFNEALKTAKSGQQAMQSGNNGQALEQFDAAIPMLVEASNMASEAGDDEVARKAKYIGSQLAYTGGRIAVKQENFEAALERFEQGIEMYPDYAKNYRARGLALKKMDQLDDAMESYAQAIEIGNENGDYETANKAEQSIRQHYLFLASQELSSENPTESQADQALTHLNELQEYVEPTADVYYYMAVAHEVKGNYSQAVSLADQALEQHNGSRSDAAKIYFVKGEALINSGDTSGACSTFENATYGDFKARAEHYLEQECSSTSASSS